MKPFQVVVGNVGQVYDGSNYMQARAAYAEYVKQSKSGRGRAGNEPVTLFHNGEIKAEHFPPSEYQPKTGARCTCKPGIERDNCPRCEGTGMVIDFARIRAARMADAPEPVGVLAIPRRRRT